MKKALFVFAICVLAGCGGGEDVGDPQRTVDIMSPTEADKQPTEEALRQAELDRLQRQADREALAEKERQAEAERLRLEAEAAEAERLRLEAEAQRQRQEKVARIERESVYLPWDHHGVPEFQRFAAWADDSVGARIELAGVTFGVTLHEGEVVPWMRGELPEGSLYVNNSEIRRVYDEFGYWTIESSDFRWRGSLVGFTPEGGSVTGSVTLSDFDFGGRNHRGIGPNRKAGWDPGKGYLLFTQLAYDDGSMWGDGDLEYEVKLGVTLAHGGSLLDNSFSHPFRSFQCGRSPSGCQNDSIISGAGVRPEGYVTTDAGEVRGMFFGPKHEAMAGTLEREDLTAAFGGER